MNLKCGIGELFEHLKFDDKIKAEIKKIRELREKGTPVYGYVTLIINRGRIDELLIQVDIDNLLTDGGVDFIHEQVYTNTTAGTRAANVIALSDDATDPVVTDTTLVGEITTGGLERVEADTISHTNGTNITVLENTFTATAVFTDIHKSALFNQTTIGGNMTHASEFTADVSLEVGDELTVIWTITAG